MEKSERQASDGEEQEAGKRWGRARERQKMKKSKTQADDGEERERQTGDREEQETGGRVMAKSKTQPSE